MLKLANGDVVVLDEGYMFNCPNCGMTVDEIKQHLSTDKIDVVDTYSFRIEEADMTEKLFVEIQEVGTYEFVNGRIEDDIPLSRIKMQSWNFWTR